MAFLNYIGSETYSVVEHIIFRREDKNIRWTLSVYDKAKEKLLASNGFFVGGNYTLRCVKGIRTEPLTENTDGDTWFVDKMRLGVGEWKGREGLLAVYLPTTAPYNGWGFWHHTPREQFYWEPTDSYVKFDHDKGIVYPSYPENDIRLWTKYFSNEKVLSSESNIIRQIYLYMQTLPAFANCISA